MNKQELIEHYEKILDYGFLSVAEEKIYTGFVEKLEQLDEPQKVTVPQFVADHLKKTKEIGHDLQDAMNSSTILEEVDLWLYTDNNMDVFARAWLDGYEIEKEKRYLVKMKGMDADFVVLKLDKIRDSWYLGNDTEYSYTKVKHTRKELEQAGFGEVFDSPLFEVEEVE